MRKRNRHRSRRKLIPNAGARGGSRALGIFVALAFIGWISTRCDSPHSASKTETRPTTVTAAPEIDRSRPAQTSVQVFDARTEIRLLATDGTQVFFAARDSIGKADAAGNVSKIFNTDPLDYVVALAADSNALFWAQDGCTKGPHSGRIIRLEHGAQTAEVIVTDAGWCVSGLVSDGGALYWLDEEPGSITSLLLRRLSPHEREPRTVWSSKEWSSARDLAIRGDFAYFIEAERDVDRIVRVDLRNGRSEEIVVEPKEVRRFAVTDDGIVYWTVCPFNSSRGVLKASNLPNDHVLVELGHSPASLVLASGFLWWFDTDKDPDTLMRLRVGDQTPEVVAWSEDDDSGSLLMLGNTAYWATNSGGHHVWKAAF